MLRLARLARLGAGSSVVVLALACSGSDKPPEPSPAPATKAPAEAVAPETDEAKAPSDPAPPPEVVAEHEPDDWLVWYRDGDGWITRWIDAADADTPRVAERKALVLSDGHRLWVVERKDADADLVGCDCLDAEEGSPECAATGRVTTLGLRAVELGGGGATVDLRVAGTEPIIAGDADYSLDVVGGVGPRLFYRWSEGGYFCGAHGLAEGGDVVFDLAAGKALEEPFSAVGKGLPKEVREPAAREVHEQLRECDGPDASSLAEVLGGVMSLTGVRTALVDGEPRITWSFEAPVYYACSADYAAHGDGHSALVDGGAPLGLSGSLPAGVVRELERIGTAPVAGWAALDLEGPAREGALAAFGGAPERPWPPSHASSQAITKTPSADEVVGARTRLSEGRTQTRAGEYAEAIASFDAAIELDPSLARAWGERGYAKLLSGDLAGAQTDLEHALPLDDGAPYQASIHYNLGLVAERRGDAAAAKAAFARSLELRDNETVRKALARVSE